MGRDYQDIPKTNKSISIDGFLDIYCLTNRLTRMRKTLRIFAPVSSIVRAYRFYE